MAGVSKTPGVAGDWNFAAQLKLLRANRITRWPVTLTAIDSTLKREALRGPPEKEKAGGRDADLDIQVRAGGMPRCLFATRSCSCGLWQDDIDDRTTTATLGRCAPNGS